MINSLHVSAAVAGRALLGRGLRAVLFAGSLCAIACPLHAQVCPSSSHAPVYLKTRSNPVCATPETTTEFIDAMKSRNGDVLHGLVTLNEHPSTPADQRRLELKMGIEILYPVQGTTYMVRVRSGDVMHGLVTFNQHPSREDRERLDVFVGVRVLNHVQGTTYRTRVKRTLNPERLRKEPLQPYLVRLSPWDRVDPVLLGDDFSRFHPKWDVEQGTEEELEEAEEKPNWVLSEDGRSLNVTVRMHPNLAPIETAGVLEKFARPLSSIERLSDRSWRMTIHRSSLLELARRDSVQWIDAGPGPFVADNNYTRKIIGAEDLQDFEPAGGRAIEIPKGLAGRGVQVGVFDTGIHPHGDFDDRLVVDDPRSHYHATLIAGTIAGYGTWSEQSGERKFEFRGMAPAAQLLDIYQKQPHGRAGTNTDVHWRYITEYGMDVSNHSYAFNFRDDKFVDGSYDDSNRARDEIIRGDAFTSRARAVPPRLHVTSAGNLGDRKLKTGSYFTLNKQLKNALVVGNWDRKNWVIAAGSSRGPTRDGRIKPDVVAPGTDVTSTLYCSEEDKKIKDACKVYRPNPYVVDSGTSQAAAAVTGALALVLERYQKTYGVNLDLDPPLPSTLRALMIHTARNKPGRDAEIGTPIPSGTQEEMRRPSFDTGWGLINVARAADAVKERLLAEGRVAGTCEAETYSFEVPIPAPSETPPAMLRVTLAWDDVAADSAIADEMPKLVNDLDLVLTDKNGIRYHPWRLDQESKPLGPLRYVSVPRLDDAGDGLQQQPQGVAFRLPCGAPLDVRRRFVMSAAQAGASAPSAVPGDHPNNVNAVMGDHLNNVEVVDAPFKPGKWHVHVIGFNIPQGPQSFSLVGFPFRRVESQSDR